jgi:hypothetical protein
MSASGEFRLFLAELSHADERAILEGASLNDVLAIAATRDSDRVLAAIADEEFDSAPTLRPASIGFASSDLDDTETPGRST